jgi:hypothetical protein
MKTALGNCEAIGACGVKQDSDGRELQRALRASVSEALDVQRRGHGVHGIVLAIRDSLARGEDADQLSAKVDQALDAASKHLAEKGYTQDQIDAAVARFRDRLVHEIDALAGDVPASGAAQRTAVAVAAREVTRERFSLDILTAEGDKVSIRFKSLNVTDVAAAQVSNGNGTATAVEANVIARGRFKLEVDGNLNEAERAAIGDLLDEVGIISKDFFGGDVQAAFAAASRVGLESDALSAFSLRLSYSKSTAVAAKAYASTAALTDAPTAPAPAPVAAKPTGVSKLADAPAGDSTTPESTTAPAPSPTGPATPAASARQTIASFTKNVLARLATAGNVDSVNLTMRWKVEFLVSAISSVATTPGQQAATDALGQALDSSVASGIS